MATPRKASKARSASGRGSSTAARAGTASGPGSNVTVNSLGKRIVDGAPLFRTVNGVAMNRKQWLAATADERHAAVKAELEQHAAKEG